MQGKYGFDRVALLLVLADVARYRHLIMNTAQLRITGDTVLVSLAVIVPYIVLVLLSPLAPHA